jgi:predicted metal-dependent hydrolase
MGQHILDGTPPVTLILRKSARARRISLRISQLDGRVTLTLPRGVSEAEGIAFARANAV